MIVAGIDPGVKGGICILKDGKMYKKMETPILNGEINYNSFNKLIDVMKGVGVQHVFLEEVHALFNASAKSTFSFGQAFGAARMVASSFPHTLVQPKRWQKEVWQGQKEIRIPPKTKKDGKISKSKVDTKLMSSVAVTRLFPDTEFRSTSEKTGKILKNMHDGIVDAALIALYGHRMLTRGVE